MAAVVLRDVGLHDKCLEKSHRGTALDVSGCAEVREEHAALLEKFATPVGSAAATA